MNYHGTTIEHGNKAIDIQTINKSVSTPKRDHWLGDGIYLYTEDFYAYRWIKMMYDDDIKTGKYNISGLLFENFMILGVELECKPEREFRMTSNPVHGMVFEMIRKKEAEKRKNIDEYKDKRISDGTVLNIMFNELDYGKSYDLVRCNFPTKEKDPDSRTTLSQEEQICVKNEEIIKHIIDISSSIDEKKYETVFEMFQSYKKGNGGIYGKRNKSKWKKLGRGIEKN